MGIETAIIGGAIVGAIGSNSAAKKQSKATQAGIASNEALAREGMEQLAPYREAGATALGGISSMVNDPTQALQGIAQSQQFQDQLGLASRNAMRYASATGQGGGLQSSGTSNQLAMLAPQLQNQIYQQQLQNKFNLANLGLGAAQQTAAGLGSLGQAQLSAMQNMGAAQAQGAMGTTNAIQGGLTGLGSLSMYRQMGAI